MHVRCRVVSVCRQERATDTERIEAQHVRLPSLSQQGRDLPVVHLFVVAGGGMCGTIGARRQECRQRCVLRPVTERHVTNEERLAARLQDTREQEATRPGLTMWASFGPGETFLVAWLGLDGIVEDSAYPNVALPSRRCTIPRIVSTTSYTAAVARCPQGDAVFDC